MRFLTTRWWQKTEMQVPVTDAVFAEQGVVDELIGEYRGISSKATNDTLADARFLPCGLETWPGVVTLCSAGGSALAAVAVA